jgi:hypothetical protein
MQIEEDGGGMFLLYCLMEGRQTTRLDSTTTAMFCWSFILRSFFFVISLGDAAEAH